MDIKHNIPLIVGLALPVVMILFVIASIYVPGLFIQPHYNFLYATGSYPIYNEKSGNEYKEHRFDVDGGRLVEKETISVANERVYPVRDDRPTFYIYDVQTDSNKELSFEQAAQLSLDANIKSPDGFEVTYGSGDGGVFPFVFWSERDYDKRYLKGKNVSRAISVNTQGRYNGFNFIGWIVK